MRATYEQQLDIEDILHKKKYTLSSLFCTGGLCLIICFGFVCGMMIPGLVKSLPGPYPNSTVGRYIEPVISPSSCDPDGKGTMIGQIGVTYQSIIYYILKFCGGRDGETMEEFKNRLLINYPVNTTLTVWFYPDTLPITYTSNPYHPIETNIFFWYSIIAGGLVIVGLVFLIVGRVIKK